MLIYRLKFPIFVIILVTGILIPIFQARADSPVELVMTGRFVPLESPYNLNTYTFYTRDIEERFRLEDLWSISGPNEILPSSLLENTGPPRIRIIGNNEIIKKMKGVAPFEKQYRIRGTLYIADGAMWVTSVEQAG